MSNPIPDNSLCRAAASPPIASASAAAPQSRPLHFSRCSLITSIRFNCCSLILSASAAACRLRPLQLLLPDCVCFNCSPIASASTAPRLYPIRLLLPDCVCFSCCSPIECACSCSCSGRFHNALEYSLPSLKFSKLKYEGRASLV